jgi:hypothetical protein
VAYRFRITGRRTKELARARAATTILATRAAQKRAAGEAAMAPWWRSKPLATGNNVGMVAMIDPPTVNAVRRPERLSS